jgi:predicted acylesterase/phospholipase RssA
MFARIHLGVFAVALALGIPALGDECASAPNLVVNVGLPYGVRVLSANQIARSKMLSSVQPAFGGARFHACPGKTQVNVAVGSDYQILDWLGRGALDAAVISSLSLDLLTSDGIELLEITSPQLEGSELLLRRVPVLRVRSHGVEREEKAEEAERAIAPALEAIWKGALLQSEEVRLIFASHLTTAGFLVPVVQVHRWLEAKLNTEHLVESARSERRDRFWSDLFEHSCFHFGEPERCRRKGEITELEFSWERAEAGRDGEGLRDHLVMRADLARNLFAKSALVNPQRSSLVDEVRELIQRTPDRDVPTPFRSHAAPEEYFGTRTFAFTVDETLRLLELNREIAGDRPLALVLPGGGVKAAFQSRLIDELYGKGRLANAHAASNTISGQQPLSVEYVVGTSGGALLGYFVARLGSRGPFNLTNLLWYRDGGNVVLSNSDLFPGIDLPRYASLVAVLIVFCLVLRVACSLPKSWLASPPTEEDTRPKTPVGRIFLLLGLFALVAVTPFLVRCLSGDAVVEQVSQIAGLLFAAMLVVVMFADQCLIAREDRQEAEWPLRSAVFVLVFGLLLLFGPLVAPAWMQRRVPAGVAYLALLLVGHVAAGAYLRRSGSRAAPARFDWVVLVGALLSALAAPLIEQLVPHGVPERVDAEPMFNLFLFILVPVVVAVLLRRRASSAAATVLVSLLASLVAWELSRPVAGDLARHGVLDLISLPSRMDATTGALFANLGALLACFGGVLVLHDRPDQFRLEDTSGFRRGLFLLILPLGIFVLVVLGVLARLQSHLLTFFELTPGFWIGLIAVSALASLALVAWSHPRLQWIPGSQWVSTTLHYLTGLHPNARFVQTRYWRLLVVAFGGLFWWNFVIAPGLYGNRLASEYLANVDERFIDASGSANGASGTPLTTRLIVTANVLDKDQKRWVVAVGADQPCPPPRKRGAGIVWYRFRTGTPHSGDADCEELDLGSEDDRRRFRKFIFASGSPFPIFPAMRVVAPKPVESRLESLVDGGFSNNTPLEVAAMAGAERVLIVNSSYPIEPDEGPSEFLAAGPLVQGAMRLPAFLFERAQQSDRRSRENLFVVSLSPSLRDDWPALAEFTSSTIERVLKAAKEDLDHRIGMVEAWGIPRFQASESR